MSEPRRDQALTRVVVRPIGTPLPLGFLALLVATTGFSALQLGWIPASQGDAVALGVLALTVPLQLLASVYGFQARDPVAGTGMGMLAGTWGAAALVSIMGPRGEASPGLGVLFLASAVAMLVPALAGTTKLVAAGVMTLTSIRFGLTGLAETTGDQAWMTAAGVAGLVLAAASLYAAFAFEIEDARHRTVLPLGRRGPGQHAMSGDVGDALGDVAREAGVREQL